MAEQAAIGGRTCSALSATRSRYHRGMSPLGIAGISAAGLLLVGILIYNMLVGRKNQVENAFSSIDVMLKKRHDLIPGLVATVKQYAAHEQATLTQLTELRARAAGAGPSERVGLENQLTQALGRIMVVAENYPTLMANESFQQLQRTLNEVEEQLSAARRAYNAAVTDFNNALEMFPTNVVGKAMSYERRPLFVLDSAAERQRPDVAQLFRS